MKDHFISNSSSFFLLSLDISHTKKMKWNLLVSSLKAVITIILLFDDCWEIVDLIKTKE